MVLFIVTCWSTNIIMNQVALQAVATLELQYFIKCIKISVCLLFENHYLIIAIIWPSQETYSKCCFVSPDQRFHRCIGLTCVKFILIILSNLKSSLVKLSFGITLDTFTFHPSLLSYTKHVNVSCRIFTFLSWVTNAKRIGLYFRKEVDACTHN